MQRLGQHFLQNQSVLRKVAESLDVKAGDTIVEIGPGHGELTKELGDRLKVMGDSGAQTKLIAIERDEKLAEALKKYFPKVELHVGDALKILPDLTYHLNTPDASVGTPTLRRRSYSLIGNIPYYITGHLFRIIGELPNLPKQCVFTIQKEVAERACAKQGAMNKLSASMQLWANPEIVAIVPQEDFKPVPKVDSAIIKLTTKNLQLTKGAQEAYYNAVRVLFAQPRKTALNNIVESIKHQTEGMGKERVIAVLEKAGIDPKSRPQDLSIEQIMKLSSSLYHL